jgi:hypothetical protein
MHSASTGPLLLSLLLCTARPASSQGTPARPPPGDAMGYVPEILSLAQQHRSALQACYRRASRGSQNAWRSVQAISLIVEADGRIRDLQMDPSGAEARRFRGCLLPLVRTWRLRPPASGAAVVLTYAASDLSGLVSS